jgi:hypothetical protein
MERIIKGRVIVTVGRAADMLGRSPSTVVRYWEEGTLEGFKGTNRWLYLFLDSVLHLRDQELKNDAP